MDPRHGELTLTVRSDANADYERADLHAGGLYIVPEELHEARAGVGD